MINPAHKILKEVTEIKQSHLYNDAKVKVQSTEHKGNGLFAVVDIMKDEVILLAKVTFMDDADWDIVKNTEPVKLYRFAWEDKHAIPLGRWKFDFKNIQDRILWKSTEFYKEHCQGGLRLSGFLFVNDIDTDTTANVTEFFEVDDNIIGIRAIRDISSGEELIKEYNYDWHTEDQSWREGILEGLNLVKKKFPDRYFDLDTFKEFTYYEANDHPTWYKYEYNERGSQIYYEDYTGGWAKWEYDNLGRVIYYENFNGDTQETTYNDKGFEVKYKRENGEIITTQYDKAGYPINEGLNLFKKKFTNKYLDWDTGEEFPYTEIDQHPQWYKNEYDADGNVINSKNWDGSWVRFDYDSENNLIYQEDSNKHWIINQYNYKGQLINSKYSDGYWIKYEYNDRGDEIYYENSDGIIKDNRDEQLDEGLNLFKKPNDTYFDNVTGDEFNVEDIDKHPDWGKEQYDISGNCIYYEDSEGYWRKYKYDKNNNCIYLEDSEGSWEKREYDNDNREIYVIDNDGDWIKYKYNDRGQEIYSEDSKGVVVDNRNEQLNEDLTLEKNQFKYYDEITGEEFDITEINDHPVWYKLEHDLSGNEIYREYSDGDWYKWEYNDNGILVYYEDYNGNKSDKRDNLESEVDESTGAGGGASTGSFSAPFMGPIRREIREGLNLVKKKYQPRYFDWKTGDEFKANNIDQHPAWFKYEYDDRGQPSYFEDSAGYWIKYEYDQFGNEIYYEDSDGNVEDNRNGQLNEGLNLQKKEWKYFDIKTGKEFPKDELDQHARWGKSIDNYDGRPAYTKFYNGAWFKYEYDGFGRCIHYQQSDGKWWDFPELHKDLKANFRKPSIMLKVPRSNP